MRHIQSVFLSMVFFLFAGSNSGAALVEGYPDRLTLQYVLETAEKRATIFESLRASEESFVAPRLTAEAPFSPRLTLGVRRFDQQLEPANPFAPSRNEGVLTFAGIEQGVRWSGTRLAFQLEHGDTSLRFPTVPIAPYYETRAIFTLQQSLLQSLWKGVERERVKAGIAGERANRVGYLIERDRATYTMIELFYRAWLAQVGVEAARDNLKNQEDLLSITRLRLRRGTAERPDLLQVQSAAHHARIQVEEAERALGDVWRYLVVTLDLPRELLSLDPMKIPVDLDDPVSGAQAKCLTYGKTDSKPAATVREEFAKAQAEAAQAQARALKGTTGSDFLLTGNYVTNGIDTASRSDTWRTTRNRDFPAWTLELVARIPLGTSATEGEALQAAANRIRAEANAEQELRTAQVERMNRCQQLAEKVSARKLAKQILDGQVERIRLEKERFRIGRSTLTQVVIASDDRVFAERGLRAAEIQERLTAWAVNELEGSLQEIALGLPSRKVSDTPVEVSR